METQPPTKPGRFTATRKTTTDLPARSPREQTIYTCNDCDTRYLGTQWCPDCNRPCRRLGPGGECDCGELLTIEELLNGSRP